MGPIVPVLRCGLAQIRRQPSSGRGGGTDLSRVTHPRCAIRPEYRRQPPPPIQVVALPAALPRLPPPPGPADLSIWRSVLASGPLSTPTAVSSDPALRTAAISASVQLGTAPRTHRVHAGPGPGDGRPCLSPEPTHTATPPDRTCRASRRAPTSCSTRARPGGHGPLRTPDAGPEPHRIRLCVQRPSRHRCGSLQRPARTGCMWGPDPADGRPAQSGTPWPEENVPTKRSTPIKGAGWPDRRLPSSAARSDTALLYARLEANGSRCSAPAGRCASAPIQERPCATCVECASGCRAEEAAGLPPPGFSERLPRATMSRAG